MKSWQRLGYCLKGVIGRPMSIVVNLILETICTCGKYSDLSRCLQGLVTDEGPLRLTAARQPNELEKQGRLFPGCPGIGRSLPLLLLPPSASFGIGSESAVLQNISRSVFSILFPFYFFLQRFGFQVCPLIVQPAVCGFFVCRFHCIYFRLNLCHYITLQWRELLNGTQCSHNYWMRSLGFIAK
ncbi:hypothetical protein AQUCO_01400594v1 [Aquilegia coerulea]|uniref:Uncharacterized protein n=1 Tax=Aquilegia coerulea TaxID=218851 RepID=A0A2G5DX68_AQUCA|nr:hypothetical protein AQUCO_01400594v1 [Aquilegia coerulea]